MWRVFKYITYDYRNRLLHEATDDWSSETWLCFNQLDLLYSAVVCWHCGRPQSHRWDQKEITSVGKKEMKNALNIKTNKKRNESRAGCRERDDIERKKKHQQEFLIKRKANRQLQRHLKAFNQKPNRWSIVRKIKILCFSQPCFKKVHVHFPMQQRSFTILFATLIFVSRQDTRAS